MGIYIAGIDMPHDGEFKHIRIYDNGDVTVEFSDGEAVIAHASPIPPHGRLIDADALAVHKFVCAGRDISNADGGACYRRGWNDAVEAIMVNAPTIIPADDKDINVLGKEEGE